MVVVIANKLDILWERDDSFGVEDGEENGLVMQSNHELVSIAESKRDPNVVSIVWVTLVLVIVIVLVVLDVEVLDD